MMNSEFISVLLRFGRFSLILIMVLHMALLQGCGDDEGPCMGEEVVAEALFPTDVTPTSAEINASVRADEGCFEITQKGLCYSEEADPTIDDAFTDAGPGPGDFTMEITGLLPEQTYYVRPYAIQDDGTVHYGSTISFQTSTGPGKTVTDIQGNVYPAVVIGEQCWMAQNLRVRAYSDGATIPSSSYLLYENDGTYENTYGLMYFGHDLDMGKLCPEGWHVPLEAEFDELIEFLGGPEVAGGKMKQTGTLYWNPPNEGATNESGFNGLPGGLYTTDPEGFFGIGEISWFMGQQFGYSLSTDNTMVGKATSNTEGDAAYCRCVED